MATLLSLLVANLRRSVKRRAARVRAQTSHVRIPLAAVALAPPRRG